MATRENETKVLLPRPRLAQLTHRDEQLRQTFQEFLVGALCPSLDGHRRIPFSFSTSAPDVDLYEENNEVVVKAELPGMEKDDIQIEFTDHQLSIKGEKKRDAGLKKRITIFPNALWAFLARFGSAA